MSVLNSIFARVTPALRISSRSFSSSEILQSAKSVRKQKAVHRKEFNKYVQRTKLQRLDNVDPVLGKPNNRFLARVDAETKEPNVLAKGYVQDEVDKLLFGAQEASISADSTNSIVKDAASNIRERAETQREVVYRILNIKNRAAEDVMKLKVKLATEEFQRFPGDTGSSEVQAAVATVKIYQLYKHVQENHKDYQNTRKLRMLVQRRQKLLKYLKRDNPERYFWTIAKLGLTDHSIHMEFNMDRRYMQKFKMFGEKILVKESDNFRDKQRRQRRREKVALRMLKHKKRA